MPPKQETFTYDADGNLLSDGQCLYTYDAENRLITQQTKTTLLALLGATPGGERPLKIHYTYDHANRRTGKKVLELNVSDRPGTSGRWAAGGRHPRTAATVVCS